MTYSFKPELNAQDKSWAYWEGAFSVDELDSIIKIGIESKIDKAEIGARNLSDTRLNIIRNSDVSWITPETSDWLYKKLEPIIREVNTKYFGFDLWGFVDSLQFTVYNAEKGEQHYDWHIDAYGQGKCPRKLSMVVQLSNPTSYEGGELWMRGAHESVLPKQQGIIHFFPSYTLHRVTPVTKGIRYSLVGWISGPPFR